MPISILNRQCLHAWGLSFLMTLIFSRSTGAQVTFNKVVDTTMSAAGLTKTFTGFAAPSVSGNNVAVIANVSTGEAVISGQAKSVGATVLAQQGTSAGADGTFSAITGSIAAVSGSNVVFTSGASSGGSGVFVATVGTLGATPIADSFTPAPANSSARPCAYQGGPGISGNTAVFQCTQSRGTYVGTIGSGSVGSVADFTTTVPGQGVPFTSFEGSPAISGSNVVFQGGWASGSGIYTGTAGVTAATAIADTTMLALVRAQTSHA